MVACVSPSYFCYEETINTLKYADRARNIKKKARKNIKENGKHIDQYKEIIGSLKEEIDSLKDQLKHEQLKNSFAGEGSNNPSQYRAPL